MSAPFLVEDGIREWLLDDADVSSVVGERVRPGVLDEADSLPAIVVSVDGEDHAGELDESSGLVQADVLVHAIARSYRQARILGKRIVDALADECGEAGGGLIQSIDVEDETYTPVPESDDGDTWRHVLTVRFTVFYQPTDADEDEDE